MSAQGAYVHVLLVEDDPTQRLLVGDLLSQQGYVVHRAAGLEDARGHLSEANLQLVVSDFQLGDGDGLALLREVRARRPELSFVLVTAYGSIEHAVQAVQAGADDYLTKPFSPRELTARVKAVLRRGRAAPQDERQVYAFQHLKIDTQRYEVWCDDELIELTALEFKLLAVLATYAGMVLSREQLLERVWGYDFYGEDRVVDVHIGHIRQKLERDPADPQFILTVRGVGYKFADTKR